MRIFTTIFLLFSLNEIVFSQNWLQQRIISDQFEKALEYYDAGQFVKTDHTLKKLLTKPTGDYFFPIQLIAMKTDFALGRLKEAKERGRLLVKNNTLLSESFMIMGDIFIEEGDIDVAFRMYLRSRQLKDNNYSRIDHRINKTILLNISPPAIEEQHLLLSGENEVILLLAKSYNYLHRGQPDECAYLLNDINPLDVPETYYDLYEQLKLASYQPGIETITFGVLLPLSGNNSNSGTSFFRGLNQSANQPDQTIKIAFQVEDSQSDPIKTIEAMTRLQKNRQLYGIITALDKTNALAAVNVIKQHSTPVFVVGDNEINYSDIGENIFQIQSDWMRLGRNAARWIGEYLDKDSVAILAPNDSYGDMIVDAFLIEMDALDRKVVAVERYTGKPENLEKQFQSFRKIAINMIPLENPYDEFLGMSFDSLDALFEVTDDDYFGLADEDVSEVIEDSSKVILDKIQALYMPIHPSDLNYIGTQLPLYNLNTSFVGNYAWNQPDILIQDNIGPHLENMTILTHTKNPRQDQNENEDYTLGFDMGGFLFSILKSRVSNKSEFLQKLEQENYQGLAHNISFSPEDHANQSMHILKIKNNTFSPIGIFIGDSAHLYNQQRP